MGTQTARTRLWKQGRLPILVAVEGDALAINAHTLNEGEDRTVVERVRAVLSG